MDITIDGFHFWLWKGKYYSLYCKDFRTLFKTFSRKNLGKYYSLYCNDFQALFKIFLRKNLKRFVDKRVSQRMSSENLATLV